MPFFGRFLRKLTPIIAILLAPAWAQPTLAQDASASPIAAILKPPADQPVPPLDTLILVRIDSQHVGPDFFYLILLDEKPVNARWDPDALTFSYYPDRLLPTGEHIVKVFMTQVGGPERELVAEQKFAVGQGGVVPVTPTSRSLFDLGAAPRRPHPVSPVTGRFTSDFFTLNGRASMDAMMVDLEGLGARLRQEPDNTSIFDLNGRGRSGGTDYNFRFYLTTDDTKYEQPRNRYLFNVGEAGYGFAVGDTSPRLGSLVIDGMRVRGAYGWGTFGPVTVHAAHGEARRETESRFDDQGRPINRGVGDQRLWVGRLGLWEDSPFSLGFNVLRGEEGPPDIEGAGNPGSNTVKSADFAWQFDDGRGTVRGAWAESDYDYDDPEREDVSGAQAEEIEARYRFEGHTLKLRWQLIDPGFRSLGRLSLQNDRETWGLEDSVNMWRGALTGRMFLEQFHNNVNDTLEFTTTSLRYGGQVRYRFGLRGPSITVGLQKQDRSNDAPEGETGWIDDSMKTVNLGLSHTFEMLGARNDIRVDWRTGDRTSNSSSVSGSTQDTITVTLTSRWQRGFQVDLLYGSSKNDYSAGDRSTETDRYSVRGSYTPPSRVFTLWARWESAESDGEPDTYDSDRETSEVGMRWMLGSDLALETYVRYVDYDKRADDVDDYTEHTYRIMLVQMLR